jgi:hypothetical protein
MKKKLIYETELKRLNAFRAASGMPHAMITASPQNTANCPNAVPAAPNAMGSMTALALPMVARMPIASAPRPGGAL